MQKINLPNYENIPDVGLYLDQVTKYINSYLNEECCMYSATFYSLRSKQDIKQAIDLYLKDFTYFENDSTYGYLKNDLFIQRYGVEDQGLYRVIYIVY